MLERVPRKCVTTVIINGLDGAAGKEPHRLSASHTSEHVGNTGTQGIKKEALKGVVVESTISVRDVKAVVTRVEGCVEPLVHVHGSVPEVLPCVDDKDGKGELQGRNTDPVDGLCECKLPRSKCRDKVARSSLLIEVVDATLQDSREHWVCSGLVGCNGSTSGTEPCT